MNSKHQLKTRELICIDCVNGISYIGKAIMTEEDAGIYPKLIGLEEYVLEETKNLTYNTNSIKEIYNNRKCKERLMLLRNIGMQISLQILD